MTEVRPILPPPLPALSPLPRGPFVYKFWGTLIWSVAIVGVAAICVVISTVVAALLYGLDFPASDEARLAFLHNGMVTTGITVGAIVPGLLVLAGAIRLARQSPADYLALRLPTARHAAIGLGATLLLIVGLDVMTALTGWPETPKYLIDRVRTAREYHAIGAYALAVVVVAPIVEEIMFRGFIYRGFAASRLGTGGAVVLTSLMFTAAHVQYDFSVMCALVTHAFLFGTMRAISGSTLLTMAMHALNNGVAMLELLWFY